ncbi:hotdog family protein [Saccharopolyspora terrae]|nr:hypothetical protein [Saccharopolyspora terrae]
MFTDLSAIEAATGEDLGTTEWTEITQSTVDHFVCVAESIALVVP